MNAIKLIAIGLSSLLLHACVPPPSTPEALALQQEQNQPEPQTDSKINENHSLYHFRSQPERTATADVEIESSQKPETVAACLKQHLQNKLGLPEDFIQTRSYTNNAHTVALHNPFTHKDGIIIDIVQSGINRSQIKLYANGTILSGTWRNLPNHCK